MSPRALLPLAVLSLAGCAGFGGPDPSNAAAYCTADNGYRVGSQVGAYLGNCPKDTEAAFLAGLQRGRALLPGTPQAQPFLLQMTELERQLVAASSEADRTRLQQRLREAQWWANHLIFSPGSYAVDS